MRQRGKPVARKRNRKTLTVNMMDSEEGKRTQLLLGSNNTSHLYGKRSHLCLLKDPNR